MRDEDDNHQLVTDAEPSELITTVKFDLRKDKDQGHATITHEAPRMAIRNPFTLFLPPSLPSCLGQDRPNCMEDGRPIYAHQT